MRLRGAITTGKKKCKILREIRKHIAEDNGIIYLSKDCGSDSFYCDGHCAITQAEEKYLENEINDKASKGQRIRIGLKSLMKYTSTFKQPPIDLCGLDMAVRTYYCLKRSGIESLNELSDYTEDEIRNIPNLGNKSFKEIENIMAALNIEFKKDER